MLAEQRYGAARGATRGRDAHARDRHRRRAGPATASSTAARSARPRELGHMVVEADGPRCQGNCPNHGCLEAIASGTAHRRARDCAPPSEQPDSALGRALAAGREITGRARHRARARRRRGRARGARGASAAARRRHRELVNIFNPEVVVVGGGVIAAGDLLLEPAREVAGGARRCRPSRDLVQIVPGPLRRRGRDARRRGARLRRARQRRRHRRERRAGSSSARRRSATSRTSRCGCSRRCARPTSSPARTPAARACCSTATASARRSSATTSTTSARGPASWSQRMRDGETVALVTDAGMPLVTDPGFVLVQACVAAGLAVEVLPGPDGGADRAGRQRRCRPTRWRFVGFLPAQAGRAAASSSRRPETLVAFESPRRVAASLARARRARPRAPGRGLPRADEGARGGRARHARAELAERYAGAAPRGEVVLVIGPARRRERRRGAGARRAARASSRRAREPRPAAAVVAELTGVPANRSTGSSRTRRDVRALAYSRRRWHEGGRSCGRFISGRRERDSARARGAGGARHGQRTLVVCWTGRRESVRVRRERATSDTPAAGSDPEPTRRSSACVTTSPSPTEPGEGGSFLDGMARAAVVVLLALSHWHWPVHGPVVRSFALAGRALRRRRASRHRHRRGAGIGVRAACAGRVTFAGYGPRFRPRGLATACGDLVATYTHLGAVDVRAGERLRPGARLGRGRRAARRVHLGARRGTHATWIR